MYLEFKIEDAPSFRVEPRRISALFVKVKAGIFQSFNVTGSI